MRRIKACLCILGSILSGILALYLLVAILLREDYYQYLRYVIWFNVALFAFLSVFLFVINKKLLRNTGVTELPREQAAQKQSVVGTINYDAPSVLDSDITLKDSSGTTIELNSGQELNLMFMIKDHDPDRTQYLANVDPYVEGKSAIPYEASFFAGEQRVCISGYLFDDDLHVKNGDRTVSVAGMPIGFLEPNGHLNTTLDGRCETRFTIDDKEVVIWEKYTSCERWFLIKKGGLLVVERVSDVKEESGCHEFMQFIPYTDIIFNPSIKLCRKDNGEYDGWIKSEEIEVTIKHVDLTSTSR